ncbi:hypothetical protein LLE49_25830 [Alicyclobacillus tolerans]|uniref:hypothetical protein n=1 Tax=Alicyclobacillus tolerans TaxID=90970 RepID=UPI001F2AE855|nr:hypothetical protein [Alicyclobacillus tolerans]MCF8568149.1 hypothetical protein [Alicyclobacillus tolerans]
MYTVGFRPELLTQVQALYSTERKATLAELPSDAINSLILVDEQSVSTHDLANYLDQRPEITLTYVVDAITTSKQSFAAAYRMTLVQSDNLLSYLEEMMLEQNEQMVLLFFGALPQLGTTTLALSVGSLLAQTSGLSVGVLGLNLYNPGVEFVPSISTTLDDLRSMLRLKQLTPTKLRASMPEISPGVFYLIGSRNVLQAMEYHPNDISYLINTAKKAFEVVILDIGSMLNTASALQSLHMATHRYVITRDLVVSQNRFLDQSQFVLKSLSIAPEDLLLVGNQVKSPTSLRDYARSMGVIPLVSIPTFTDLAYYVEPDTDKLKLFFSQKKFKSAIEQIVSGLTQGSSKGVTARVRN